MNEEAKADVPKAKRADRGSVSIEIDGQALHAPAGASLAAVLMQRGEVFRRSVTGEARQPLCAMGTCFECRVTVDGTPHVRACRVVVREGMVVETAKDADS